MKKLRILAVIFLSCSLQNSNASPGCITKNYSNKYITIFQKNKSRTGVTAADIVKYLTDRGYTVTSTPVQANYNWTCYTTKNGNNYFTTVITDGSKIIDHQDIRL
jgi:hypothetical protein